MSGFTINNLHIFPSGPADNDAILMSGAWTDPAPYDDEGDISVWEVTNPVPPEAVAVLIRVKLKAYVPHGTGVGYCQGNVRLVNPDAVMNHFIHVDEWERAEGGGEGRRVAYTTLFAPIIDGKIKFRVSHEIVNRGNVEFVAYLEGYVTSGHLSIEPGPDV